LGNLRHRMATGSDQLSRNWPAASRCVSAGARGLVIAKPMIGVPATEPVARMIAVTKTMIWIAVAEAMQASRAEAKTMIPVPAAEATQVNVLKQSLGAGLTISVK
jgi:hypothetical protein